ncbi:MAG: tRNA pseudouridine(55) synthase TruB [Candidatus Sabulitectum sp.]|nr:tRNA pseudouridine(55) synthase TruB [Candidatus Sabulitectum sp.]
MTGGGGVYLLDKAAGVTSRRAAMAVAKANGFKKYGHCGTLDPDATGLLVVILGKATRLASYISGDTKRYSFDLVAGVLTDTLDMSGEIFKEADCSHLTTEDVVARLPEFTGTFQQRVPLFSAVRINGKRGYKLAREGETPEMPERNVTVTDWKSGELLDNRIPLEVTVSAGTYIRALARDIGEALNIPAVADCIRRTMAGSFSISEASELYNHKGSLLSMVEAMRGYPQIRVTPSQAHGVFHGNPFPAQIKGTAVAVDATGNLLAVGIGDGVLFQPKVVLATEVQE